MSDTNNIWQRIESPAGDIIFRLVETGHDPEDEARYEVFLDDGRYIGDAIKQFPTYIDDFVQPPTIRNRGYGWISWTDNRPPYDCTSTHVRLKDLVWYLTSVAYKLEH